MQVPLRAQARRAQPDLAAGVGDPGQGCRPRQPVTSTTTSRRATSRVGVLRADHARRRTTICRSIRSTTPSCGRSRTSPSVRPVLDGCRTTSSRKSSNRPSGRACSWTASTSRTTRCSRAHAVLLGHAALPRRRQLLQLPDQAPQPGVKVYSNQRDGQMAYAVDGTGPNKHINYEPRPSVRPARGAQAREGLSPAGREGRLGRYQASRTEDDYTQAGVR